MAKKCHSREVTHQVEEPEDTLRVNGIHAVTIDTPKVGKLVKIFVVATLENNKISVLPLKDAMKY